MEESGKTSSLLFESMPDQVQIPLALEPVRTALREVQSMFELTRNKLADSWALQQFLVDVKDKLVWMSTMTIDLSADILASVCFLEITECVYM